MDKFRTIRKVIKSKPTLEGAGVHLKRAFGYNQAPLFDPFLLLDDFRSDDPQRYIKGFPWHPHRGIETITYVLDGSVEHADTLFLHTLLRAGQDFAGSRIPIAMNSKALTILTSRGIRLR
jgi:hypothetical protein